jgi:hypothetical protein
VIALGANTACTTTCADTLDRILKLDPALTSKKGSARLKNSLAMKVFNLRNMTMTLKQGLDEPDYIAEAVLAAMFFCPECFLETRQSSPQYNETVQGLVIEICLGYRSNLGGVSGAVTSN